MELLLSLRRCLVFFNLSLGKILKEKKDASYYGINDIVKVTPSITIAISIQYEWNVDILLFLREGIGKKWKILYQLQS